ncbi:MAG: aromatic amino acid transport family protein, partial [Patescibacteria group bacterium]
WRLTDIPLVNPSEWFLPYGVILFAFASASAIPDMRTILGAQSQKLKRAIQLGMLIPFVVYLLFGLSVVFVSGSLTTPDAITGLKTTLGGSIVTFGALFGVLAMTTSFLSLGLILKEMFTFDFRWRPTRAWIAVLATPFIVLLAQLTTFVSIISAVGAIMGGTEGILILLAHARAGKLGKRKPEFHLRIPETGRWVMILVFGIGIFYEIVIQFQHLLAAY